jgi:protein arginine kinase activator
MKCEKCKQRDATIHLSQTRHGKTTEHHLCETCALDQGISMNLQDYIGNIGSLFGSAILGSGSVFNTTGGIPAFGGAASQNTACSTCGQSFDAFRRSGLFGCSHCYEAFADRLDPLMRRVQGSTRHIGRKVCQTADQQEQQLLHDRLAELKKLQQQAVLEEAYEKAARLRDEIRAMESRLCADQVREADHGDPSEGGIGQ